MINILSILLSIAMMLSGAAGLETETAMANSLTIRDVYFSYNDQSFELEPTLTAGVMTENGTAVFDLAMACGEESLFPMQLVISEESATLVAEKAGKAFTIDAETLNALVDEALDLDALASDEEVSAAIAQMETAWAQALNAGNAEMDPAVAEQITAKINETFQPVEVTESTDSYEDTEYAVTVSCYELSHDQVFELTDIVMNASEDLAAIEDQIISSMRSALADAGEEVPEINSLRDIYDMIGATIAMNITVNASEDGQFVHTINEMTVSGEELPEPIVIYMNMYEVNGIADLLIETEYAIDGMSLYMGGIVYTDETDSYFEMVVDMMPEESEDLTEEDYADAVSFFVTGSLVAAEDGGSDLSFVLELNTYENGFAFTVDGHEDEAGEATINAAFDYADEYDQISAGVTIDLAKAVFANAAEGLEAIAVDPANMQPLEAEFSSVVESLMVDLQTLVENQSVTDMIAAFTAISDAQYVTEEVVADKTDDYDGYEEEYYEDVAVDNTELTFSEPEFAYIPEGMALQEKEVDVEFNSVSCTLADDNFDEVVYVYVYGDTYTNGIDTYILGEDGSMVPSENPIVTAEVDDGAIYAEMTDGNIIISLSYYGENLAVEDLGKILAGMTY